MSNPTTQDRIWSNCKRALTRAQKSGDHANIIAVCDEIDATFAKYGYPDWHHDIERARNDAQLAAMYG